MGKSAVHLARCFFCVFYFLLTTQGMGYVGRISGDDLVRGGGRWWCAGMLPLLGWFNHQTQKATMDRLAVGFGWFEGIAGLSRIYKNKQTKCLEYHKISRTGWYIFSCHNDSNCGRCNFGGCPSWNPLKIHRNVQFPDILCQGRGTTDCGPPFHIKVIMFSQLICLVVWNMNFILPYIGNNHTNWLSYFSKGLKPPTSHPFFGASSFVKHPFALKDAEKATINEKGLWCYHQMYETKWKKA